MDTARQRGRPRGTTGIPRAHNPDEELDKLISRRAEALASDRRTEELWKPSAQRYNEARAEERRQAWQSYHLEQAARLEKTAAELAAHHREKARALIGGEEAAG